MNDQRERAGAPSDGHPRVGSLSSPAAAASTDGRPGRFLLIAAKIIAWYCVVGFPLLGGVMVFAGLSIFFGQPPRPDGAGSAGTPLFLVFFGLAMAAIGVAAFRIIPRIVARKLRGLTADGK